MDVLSDRSNLRRWEFCQRQENQKNKENQKNRRQDLTEVIDDLARIPGKKKCKSEKERIKDHRAHERS